jgi:hypothetical protein
MTFLFAPWLVFSMLGLLLSWFILVAVSIQYVRNHHPAVNAALGQPVLFQSGAFRIIGYLFRRGHRQVMDPKFSLLCDSMLVCYSAFLLLFAYAYYLQLQGAHAAVQ